MQAGLLPSTHLESRSAQHGNPAIQIQRIAL
jgi:hypothetical protein